MFCKSLVKEYLPGQVKNLPLDMRGYASKYLTVPGTYVVVERKKVPIVQKKELITSGCEVAAITLVFIFIFHFTFSFTFILTFIFTFTFSPSNL